MPIGLIGSKLCTKEPQKAHFWPDWRHYKQQPSCFFSKITKISLFLVSRCMIVWNVMPIRLTGSKLQTKMWFCSYYTTPIALCEKVIHRASWWKLKKVHTHRIFNSPKHHKMYLVLSTFSNQSTYNKLDINMRDNMSPNLTVIIRVVQFLPLISVIIIFPICTLAEKVGVIKLNRPY